MNPPIRELPDIPLPGVIPLDGWIMNNHALHITYLMHIPKKRYKAWFNKTVMPNHCKGGTVLFLELAHESSDKVHRCKHTHVVIKTRGKPLRSTNTRVLYWPLLPGELEDYTHVEASIRILQTPQHMLDAKHHLSMQDPDNIRFREHGRVIPAIGQRRTIIASPVPEQYLFIATLDRHSVDPIRKVDELMRWQSDILKIMDKNTALLTNKNVPDPARELEDDNIVIPDRVIITPVDRTIHVVHDCLGGAGKRTLIRALLYAEPRRFLVIEGVPTAGQVAEYLEEVRHKTWNEDCIIINTLFEEKHDRVDKLIRGLVKVTRYLDCRNLWFFSNAMPKMESLHFVEWKVYKIYGNWKKRSVSFLRPISQEEAVAQRHIEDICISNYGKLRPRRY